MQKILPCLWFANQAEEAVQFYTSIFQNGQIGAVSRYGENMPLPKDTVLTINFHLAGFEFMALNGGPVFEFTPSVSYFVFCETVEQLDALWAKLAEGGKVLMPLDAYPFSERFGWCNDRYGVSWQLFMSGEPQHISPFLMYVGDQNGRAGEAIRQYTSLFPQSSIKQMVPYPSEVGQVEGSLMQAFFTLAGQPFMAMDGGLEHDFTFSPANSFYVNCDDQAEVDMLWDRLSEGGATEMCGWLRDRYGVSWQIVPTALGELMSDPDPARAARVTQAMLQMTKLDIAGLRAAAA